MNMISMAAELFGLGKRGPFVVGVVASPFKVSKRKYSFMHWPVPLIPFPSRNWRTGQDGLNDC